MGFGILFFGYFISYLASQLFHIEIIGYIIMAIALTKLADYNTKFNLCFLPLGLMGVISVYILANNIMDYIQLEALLSNEISPWTYFWEKQDNIFLDIAYALRKILDAVFHSCLLTAICSISKETDLPKIARGSMRNLLLIFAETVLYIVACVLPPLWKATVLIGNTSTLLTVLSAILNVWLIANCYRLICDEADRDMPAKESKNPIIRKMNAVIDKREENAKDAAQKLVQARRDRKNRKNKK